MTVLITLNNAVLNQNRKNKLKGDEFLSNFSKDDKLTPVITLVIYYGDDKWNGPQSLKDMLNVKDEIMENLVLNFSIHLIDVKHLEKEEIDKYEGSIKALFGFLAYDKDKDVLLKFIEENKKIFNDLPQDISDAINIFSKVKMEIGYEYETNTGGVDMCKAIEDLREEERNIGLQKGKEEELELLEIIKKLGVPGKIIQEAISIRENS